MGSQRVRLKIPPSFDASTASQGFPVIVIQRGSGPCIYDVTYPLLSLVPRLDFIPRRFALPSFHPSNI